MINCGLISACGLCIIGLMYAAVVQRTLIKTRGTWELPDDVHFNVTNRLTCAKICCKNVSICVFFFSKTGHCVCLKENGDYELWTVNLRTNHQERYLGAASPGGQVFTGHLILSSVKASYLGCYRDDWGRILSDMTEMKGLTTETCSLQCHGNIYFGTECGVQCFCGNIIKAGYAKRPDEECNMPCVGDGSLLCGGFFRISIYKINA